MTTSKPTAVTRYEFLVSFWKMTDDGPEPGSQFIQTAIPLSKIAVSSMQGHLEAEHEVPIVIFGITLLETHVHITQEEGSAVFDVNAGKKASTLRAGRSRKPAKSKRS